MLKGKSVQRIRTRHPASLKTGVNIRQDKYDTVKSVILKALKKGPPLTFTEMVRLAEKLLYGKFEGSVAWYVVTVKLDLEARGLLERVPKTRHEVYRLAKT